jgi:uncharacterized membrane protein
MKHLNLLLLCILLAVYSEAQDSSFVLSKYEQYATARGKALKTVGQTIGQIRNTIVDVLVTTDIKKGDTLSVIRFSSENFRFVPTIFIDKEEVPNVINLLKYYAAEIKNGSVVNGAYYSYITPNDVNVTCSYEMGLFNGSVSVGFFRMYQYLRFNAPGGHFFGKKDMDGLIKLMQDAYKAM